MPNYRIYYVERTLKEPVLEDGLADLERRFHRSISGEYISETEWEETYEGRNAGEALAGFFRDHAQGPENVRLIDEDGQPRDVGGFGDYDPDRTYIWIEEGRLMEYQGLDEATEGMVSCPLCDGTGEVDEGTAQEFLETFGHE